MFERAANERGERTADLEGGQAQTHAELLAVCTKHVSRQRRVYSAQKMLQNYLGLSRNAQRKVEYKVTDETIRLLVCTKPRKREEMLILAEKIKIIKYVFLQSMILILEKKYHCNIYNNY